MRDSSRDCHACCGRTGYAIEETPRCSRCGEVYCDACIGDHMATEHRPRNITADEERAFDAALMQSVEVIDAGRFDGDYDPLPPLSYEANEILRRRGHIVDQRREEIARFGFAGRLV